MTRYSDEDLRKMLWDELKGHCFAFVGRTADASGDVPMTLHSDEGSRNAVWIFTKRSNDISAGGPAMARIMSRKEDFFARLDGLLEQEGDRALIDRLWSPQIAAWYEGGRDDPELCVMRLDIGAAEIWVGEMSPVSIAKMLLGRNVERDMEGKHATVSPDA